MTSARAKLRGFSPGERRRLLELKGVGPAVIARLEQMGFDSLARLATAEVEAILSRAALLTGSTCWRNSPQARAAIRACVDLACSAAKAPAAKA